MSQSTDHKPVEGTAPSAPVPAPTKSRKFLVYGVIALIVVTMIVGGRIWRVNMINDTLNSADNPQPTAAASQPVAPTTAPATQSTVTYATDPLERGKQCLAAGAIAAPSPLTAEGAYESWMKNLMAAQKSHDLNRLSCAFYDISDTNAAWTTFKNFAPNTVADNDPYMMPNSGTVSGNIMVAVAGQTVTADHHGLRLEVVLRLSSGVTPNAGTGIWMVSDATLTYTT